jgi:plasmid stabilization system protein ParE
MAIVVLPDAQDDLLSLQAYMLERWSLSDWLAAEDEIFDKLATLDSGLLNGSPVSELAAVGIFDYQCVFTSHHKLVCVCSSRTSARLPSTTDAPTVEDLTV